MPQGRFIVLDGPDGCGKTTQARLLCHAITRMGREVRHLREPGGTPIGERVREILLDPAHEEMSVRTELLLYMASRAQLVEQVIRPALAEGAVVICERFLSSSVVYQGMAGGLGVAPVLQLGRVAVGGLAPDLTIVLDVDPATGLARLGRDPDRMERKAIGFHRAVRAGFRALARDDPKRVKRISARGDPAAVHVRVLREVRRRL